MFYVGLDVHSKFIAICVLDSDGKLVKRHSVREVQQMVLVLEQLVWQLQSIPGVGPRTAEAMVAFLDDPHRFERAKQVGAYFGLVPCQDQSSDRNHLGHITRDGSPTLRQLLSRRRGRLSGARRACGRTSSVCSGTTATARKSPWWPRPIIWRG